MFKPFLAVCFALLATVLMSCVRTQPQPSRVESLERDIRGVPLADARALIVDRFGPPDRDVGSGFSIEQWDVEGGILTFHSGGGLNFSTDDVSRSLIRTTNPAGACLVGSYEMTTLPDLDSHGTKYWLGNVTLTEDGHYRYTDSGQNQKYRLAQEDNFFMRHPEGAYQFVYADGVTPNKRLEELPDGARVASVTFVPADGGANGSFSIIASRSAMSLTVQSTDPMTFQLRQGWQNYWH